MFFSKKLKSALAIICRDPVLVDMAPLMAGSLHGIIDTLYSLGGIVVPILCNSLIYYDADMEATWTSVWTLLYGSMGLWLIIYITMCKSKEANFSVKKETSSESEAQENEHLIGEDSLDDEISDTELILSDFE